MDAVRVVIALEEALDRLLYSASYRAAFLEGRLDALDVAPDDRAALAAIDRDELARAATAVMEGLWYRQQRGCGDLGTQYPKTIEAWRRGHPDDEPLRSLMCAFLESDAFREYREIPFAGMGTSLEEAFFLFCEGATLGDAAVREDEFLAAMMKALAMSPSPAFALPACIRRAPGGYFALGTRGPRPMLYGAVEGRFVKGELTRFLAELLTSRPGEEEQVARRHGVRRDILLASLKELRKLGLRS